MTITKAAYTPTDGIKNATSFPNPATRLQLQTLLDQIRDDVNIVVDELEAGALDTLYYTKTVLNGGQLDTRYRTETELAATTVGSSGATLIGASSDTGVTGGTVEAQIKQLKTEQTGFVLGAIPDNTLTEAKMAAAMKKQAGGVAPYDDVIFKAGGTFTGTVSHGRNLAQQPKLKDYSEALTTNATATGTVSLDLSTANVFNETLTGITTFTFDNPATTGQAHSFTLVLNQGATAYAVTWPASVKWSNDTIPVISDVSKTCIFSFVTLNGGTRWYGTAVTKLTT